MTGCSSLRKAICEATIGCHWEKGKSCKRTETYVANSSSSNVKKNNFEFPKTCKPISTLKKTTTVLRKAPPYPAEACKGVVLPGADGLYVSKQNKHGVFKWYKVDGVHQKRRIGKIKPVLVKKKRTPRKEHVNVSTSPIKLSSPPKQKQDSPQDSSPVKEFSPVKWPLRQNVQSFKNSVIQYDFTWLPQNELIKLIKKDDLLFLRFKCKSPNVNIYFPTDMQHISESVKALGYPLTFDNLHAFITNPSGGPAQCVAQYLKEFILNKDNRRTQKFSGFSDNPSVLPSPGNGDYVCVELPEDLIDFFSTKWMKRYEQEHVNGRDVNIEFLY